MYKYEFIFKLFKEYNILIRKKRERDVKNVSLYYKVLNNIVQNNHTTSEILRIT